MATKTLRSLLSELRKASSTESIKDSLAVRYILTQFRKHQTTTEQLCKEREEERFLAETYLTYLSSMRKYNEIYNEYRGKGERSVEETANLVGFKLPHDPK